MKRPVFLSFCYHDDVTRVQQIRNMGVIKEQGQPLLNANDFESIKRKGNYAIQNWIDEQLKYKQCLIVLIGENTASRPWVQYEIKKADSMGKPIFGIYIHNLKNISGYYSKKGQDPFVKVFGYKKYNCYDPAHIDYDGCRSYNIIDNNIEKWIESTVSSKAF